jgi:ankyrin repeat protein
MSCISPPDTGKESMDGYAVPVDTHKDGTKRRLGDHNEVNRGSKIQTFLEVIRCELARPGRPSPISTNDILVPTKEWTPLYYAVYHNREAALLYFLQAGQSPNGVVASDHPPICIATIVGHAEIVKILCEEGANPNATTKLNGETALHTAIKDGRNDIVNILLSHDPDIDAKNTSTGDTPLHYAAARADSLAAVVVLLKRGASYEALNTKGCSPAAVALHSHNIKAALAIIGAARGQQNKLVEEKEMLLKHVEKAHNRVSMKNELIADVFEAGCPFGSTVLIEAIKMNQLNLVDMFLQKGADPNQASSSGTLPIFAALNCSEAKIVHALVVHKADVTLRDARGLTVLQAALDSPLTHDEKVTSSWFEVLLSNGADLQASYPDGSTILHRVIGKELGLAKAAQLLLQHGCNINEQDESGNTALHLATHQQSCTGVLLKHGADVNIVNKRGLTPLLYATRHLLKEEEPILDDLIKASDLHKVDQTGRTALHLAARSGLQRTVRSLVQAGVDTSVASKKRTPLLLAVLNQQWHVVPFLAAQPGTNFWDEAGLTALHHLAMSTPSKTSTWKDIDSAIAPFCDKGVSRSMRDYEGATPLILAVKSLPEDGLSVIEMLLSQKGPESSNCVGHEDLQGRDALYYAVTLGKPSFVAALLQHGSPVTWKEWRPSKGRVQPDTAARKKILKLIAEHEWCRCAAQLRRQSIDASNDTVLPGVLPLRELEQLLIMGLDPNTLPKSKLAGPLLWIILNQISHQQPLPPQYLYDSIKLVLSFGADPNMTLTRSLRRRSSAQIPQEAGLTTHPITFLLEKNVAVDITLVNLLLDSDAKLSIASSFFDGRYPLHSAVITNRLDIVDALIARKFDLNYTDNKGRTPLFIAAEKDILDIANLLSRSGANVNAKDTSGNTPLHAATLTGNKTLISNLLRAGAKACSTNAQNKTPLDLVPSQATEKDAIMTLLTHASSQEQKQRETAPKTAAQPKTNTATNTDKPLSQPSKPFAKPPPIHISQPSIDIQQPSIATPVHLSKQMVSSVSVRYMPSIKRQRSAPSISPHSSIISLPPHPAPDKPLPLPPASPSLSTSKMRIDSPTAVEYTRVTKMENTEGKTGTEPLPQIPLPALTRAKSTLDQVGDRESKGEELASWLAISQMMDRL